MNRLLSHLKARVHNFEFSLETLEDRLGRRVAKLNISVSSVILIVAILIYTVVFSAFTILRHYDFQSSGWDLGIYMQSLYTAAFKGQPLRYTIEQFTFNPGGSFFGVHFSPLVLSLVPIYRLAPFAETLLILQSFIIALGALGVYLLSNTIHATRFVSLSFAMSYLLCTPLQVLNWFDFHIQAFIPILFFMMFFFYIRGKFVASFVFFALTLSTIEIMPVLLVPFGLYCLISSHKERKAQLFALAVIFTSIFWFILGAFIKASINPVYQTTFGAWSTLGSSYVQILTSPITKPFYLLGYFFTVFPLEKVLYFLWLVTPLLFLPLFARKEFVLLVMPWIVMLFLSTYTGYFTNQYGAFVVPQLFIAAVYGLKQLSKTIDGITVRKSFIMRYSKWFFWMTIASFILVGPFTFIPQATGVYIHGIPVDTANKELLRNALQLIPENASIYTSFRIEPHLANRWTIYANNVSINEMTEPPDYIVIDLRLLDSSISLGTFGEPAIIGADELLERYNYSLVFSNDGILIYRINASILSIDEPITLTFNYNDLSIDSASVKVDNSSYSGSVLVHGPTDQIDAFWHGPYIALPRGVYGVTFRLKADEILEGHMLTLDVTSESGQTTLAQKHMYGHDFAKGKWEKVTLQFSIEQPKTFVEFRGTSASNMTTQSLDFINLRQLAPRATGTFGTFDYNYRDMERARAVLSGNSTYSDITSLTSQERNTPAPFSFSIYKYSPTLPLGTYSVHFWLRLDDFSQGHVFSLTVNAFNESTHAVNLARIDISAPDFSGNDPWKCFSLPFVYDSVTNTVEITGTGDIGTSFSFSYIELKGNMVESDYGV